MIRDLPSARIMQTALLTCRPGAPLRQAAQRTALEPHHVGLLQGYLTGRPVEGETFVRAYLSGEAGRCRNPAD